MKSFTEKCCSLPVGTGHGYCIKNQFHLFWAVINSLWSFFLPSESHFSSVLNTPRVRPFTGESVFQRYNIAKKQKKLLIQLNRWMGGTKEVKKDGLCESSRLHHATAILSNLGWKNIAKLVYWQGRSHTCVCRCTHEQFHIHKESFAYNEDRSPSKSN